MAKFSKLIGSPFFSEFTGVPNPYTDTQTTKRATFVTTARSHVMPYTRCGPKQQMNEVFF